MSDGNPSYREPWLVEGFTSLPNALWIADDLSANAKLLYAALTFHSFQKGRAWPGQPTLAAETGLSDSSVRRALRELEDYGVLETVRRGQSKTNLYFLHPEVLIGQSDRSESVRVTGEEEQGEEEEVHPLPPSGNGNGSSSPEVKDVAQRVYDHHRRVMSLPPRSVPADERRLILKALKDTEFNEGDLCRAISACAASDWHMKRGQYRDREGGKHNALSKIIKGRRGQETTTERIQWWLDRTENAAGAGLGIPSADPAVIARRKQEVQRGHRFDGDEMAMRKAQEAEAWLRQHGIETIRDETEDGYPTFRDAEAPVT